MIETAKKWLEENYENLIQDLTRLIACKSVEGEAKEGMPFGEECYKALECAGEICQKFGFKFHNCEGYVGYMDYEERGEMPEYGILVHVDVVPPCNFTDDPYTLVRKDGKLIARGAIDDKGPCVIMIYVLAALKQAGFKPKSNIRLMFGANEETGWRDIEYAKSHGLIPKRGYSPDADYPLINEEKGICAFTLEKDFDTSIIKRVQAGNAVNAVPDVCTAVINLNEEELNRLVAPLKDKATVQGGRITAFGKAAHASINNQGDNAALKMLSILKEHNKDIALLFEVFNKLNGTGFGIAHSELTATLSVLDIYNNRLKVAIDIRYPYGVEFNEVRENLENTFKDFSVTLKNNNPLHRVSKDDPLCVSLLKAYTQETGKEGKAITIGGGTFSRAFETGVAFGCTFEDEPMCAHMADEYITEESVKLNLKIQLAGVYELCK